MERVQGTEGQKDRRLNWMQAKNILGCSKSTFFDLVSSGKLAANGVGKRNRWYWESDVRAILASRSGES